MCLVSCQCRQFNLYSSLLSIVLSQTGGTLINNFFNFYTLETQRNNFDRTIKPRASYLRRTEHWKKLEFLWKKFVDGTQTTHIFIFWVPHQKPFSNVQKVVSFHLLFFIFHSQRGAKMILISSAQKDISSNLHRNRENIPAAKSCKKEGFQQCFF